MAQIGATEMAAGVAIAIGVEGAIVALIFGVLDDDFADGCVEQAIARGAGGQNAVEHIDAGEGAGHEVDGGANAHQVAGTVGGEQRRAVGDAFVHVLGRLAHAVAAERVAGQVEGADFFDVAAAQIFEQAALDNAEEGTVFALPGALTAVKPARGAGE